VGVEISWSIAKLNCLGQPGCPAFYLQSRFSRPGLLLLPLTSIIYFADNSSLSCFVSVMVGSGGCRSSSRQVLPGAQAAAALSSDSNRQSEMTDARQNNLPVCAFAKFKAET
jgi:hypothetical protein